MATTPLALNSSPTLKSIPLNRLSSKINLTSISIFVAPKRLQHVTLKNIRVRSSLHKNGRNASAYPSNSNLNLYFTPPNNSYNEPSASIPLIAIHLLHSLSNVLHQTRSFLIKLFSLMKKPIAISLVALSILFIWPQMASAAKGGGRMGGKSFSGRHSSQTYSSPSRGSYSSPSFSSPIMSTPYYSPAPFFGGFGPSIYIGGRRGGNSIISMLVFSISVFFLIKIITNYLSAPAGAVSSGQVSIVRLQVGLLGLARSLQTDLERIAERADTSSPQGLHYILSETLLSLMRHPDYCVYAKATSEVKYDEDEIESAFNRLSMEERGKFQEETLVNVGNVRRRVNREHNPNGFNNEFIVVTVLVAVEGRVEISEVKTANDLKQSLALMGSITEDRVQAVEILWTPQNSEDTLSERELLQDYPQLNVL